MQRIKKLWQANLLKWFIPGMGVKRWLFLLALGVALLGMGLIYLILILYRAGILPRSLYLTLTLQFLPPWGRIAAAVLVSLLLIAIALYQLGRSTLAPFLQTGGLPLVDAVYRQRLRRRGPRVVAIGGGHGLSTLLRGLKAETSNLTAIITVADDGGSSGRLRRELGLPPPGDFRNCIAALADDESLVTQLFQYRFGLVPGEPAAGQNQLTGHSFGNLFIAAMTGVTGSFESGLARSSQVLAIQGEILPSTLADVTLVADVREQSDTAETSRSGTDLRVQRVEGESLIPKTGRLIERVYLSPENAPAYPAAVRAILSADLVILGPGSLYTSVMPNLLVKGIQQALRHTPAPVIFVCNVANQPGETDNYDLQDHLAALERHIGRGIIDTVLANDHQPVKPVGSGVQFVALTPAPTPGEGPALVTRDLLDAQQPWRHDSKKLSRAVLSLQRANLNSQQEGANHDQDRN